MKRLNIAFDLDGTCVDLQSQFAKTLKEWTGKDILQGKTFEVYREMHINKELFWLAIEEAYKNWRDTYIFYGVRSFLGKLKSLSDDPIYFVTARSKKFASETFQLVNKFCPFPFKIAMCDNSDNKIDYLKGYKYFVEDRRRTAIQLALTGMIVYAPPRIYNEMEIVPNTLKILTGGMKDLIPLATQFVEEV